jgi:hypothetical protein
VCDTDTFISACFLSSAFIKLDLPAPEGADKMNKFPRECAMIFYLK